MAIKLSVYQKIKNPRPLYTEVTNVTIWRESANSFMNTRANEHCSGPDNSTYKTDVLSSGLGMCSQIICPRLTSGFKVLNDAASYIKLCSPSSEMRVSGYEWRNEQPQLSAELKL
jgi:hypothetical protein